MKKHAFEPELKQPQRMLLVLSIGLLLTFANCYWIIVAEAMWFAIHITVMSIFFNAVFCLFVLLLVNLLLKRISPKVVISKAELLMIYMMMCMGSAISGHGFMQLLIPLMGHVFWYASPENDWANLIHPHIPSWMCVEDKKVLRAHYMGDSTFYTMERFHAWITPILPGQASFLCSFLCLCVST